ncbi:MAG: 2-dehydropantoate 2-reductase [Acidobacteriota bacterium]
MRFAIIGAGGVGGYFGGKLAQAGNDVTFIARGATLAALRKQGLRVDSINGNFEVDPVKVSDDPASPGAVDAVLFAVKAWQLPDAAAAARPLFGPGTVAVPLENGMEAPEQLSRILGPEHVLGGLCAIVSYVAEPGYIKHVGAEPMIVLGELDGSRTDRVELLRSTIEAAGVKAEVPADIHRSLWTKFLFIAPMSGVGALTRVSIGDWRAMPEPRELAKSAIREILALAVARGISLASDALDATLARYDALPSHSTSSLQRDVIEGKPSELDAQLGAVVRMAAETGVQVPVCQMMYSALLPQERMARGRAS